ncbi:ABC transporter permease [Nocardioides soli]|uniref:ABC-2 type transport system permease protein n=1 Tax=Nocardioides soli TaxID=1036020 RepID=A0A7W4W040_9ACTN|nr:ABC-2 type transport system permease protein [Nocardioides soli]
MRDRLRQLWLCYRLQLKILLISPFEGFLGIVFPLMFATATLMVYAVNGDEAAMAYAGLGAAVMGVWTSVTVSASTLLNRERFAGTLELLVAAPTPFSMVLMPITTAMATVGLVSVGITLVWNRLVFGVQLQIQNWLLFVLSVLAATVTIAMFGFLLSVVAVRYRTAWALGASLEYPGWLLCGFVVPIALLPVVLHPISYALAPTWAVEAMRIAAAGGNPWNELTVCLALGLGYAAFAAFLGVRLIDSARRNATLALT